MSVYVCRNTETEIEKLGERDQWILDSLEGIGGFHFTLCPSLYTLLRFQAVVSDKDSLICIKQKSGGISEFWKFSPKFSFFAFLISSLPLFFLLPFIPIWFSWQRILWQLLCINCMIDLLIGLFHSALMLTMKKWPWCLAPHLLGSTFFYLGHR